MDTAAAQWPHQQDIVVVKPMEEMMLPKPSSSPSVLERNKATMRQHKEHGRSSFSCPRCNSNNTKFCYYNNYSLSQPRFFCKTCRRYWTQGGSLRNIPVGGASRKNNKINNNNNNSKKLPDLVPPQQQQNPSNSSSSSSKDQDLNLGFSIPAAASGFKSFADMIQLPAFQNPNSMDLMTADTSPSSSSRVLYSNHAFMPVVGSGFHSLPELNKSSSLNFSLDGLGGNYGGFQGAHEENNNSSDHDKNKILFPFEDLKQDSSTDRDNDQHQNGDPTTRFWNGVLGGGSW